MIHALFLVLVAALAPPSGTGGGRDDALARLYLWMGRARQAPGSIDEQRRDELAAIVGELRIQRAGLGPGVGADAAAIDLGLVGLASLEARDADGAAAVRASARLGRIELEGALARHDEVLARRLAEAVLDPERHRPRSERLLAAELLAGVFQRETLPILCAAAREEDRELAHAAVQALVGWQSPLVHGFLLDEIERGEWFAQLTAEHFARMKDTLDEALRQRLAAAAARLYLAEDWRSAARARGLLRGLETARAVPLLIESLALWERRTQAGQGSRRIRAEIVQELRRLSGRNLGTDAQRWLDWWEGVRAGRTLLPEDVSSANTLTIASFFGLHAETDRVLFVVDRSGSMRARFGTGERSRYGEAIEQLLTFLRRSGEDTHFDVAVFSDEGVLWHARMAQANAGSLELVQRWLTSKEPGGGTLLYQGVRAGLSLDTRGKLALERCEADTVIVLCDGATSDGAEWVTRWLAEENERAQLVFHCVQIGDEGNGTLEALAKGSGGEFVHIDG